MTNSIEKMRSIHRLSLYFCLVCLALPFFTACKDSKPTIIVEEDPEVIGGSMEEVFGYIGPKKIDWDKRETVINMEEMNRFLNAAPTGVVPDYPDNFSHERIVEVREQKDVDEIVNLWNQEAKSHFNPETHKFERFSLPVHAILDVHSATDHDRMADYKNQILGYVSTLEYRIHENSGPWRGGYFGSVEGALNRVIISGYGSNPVEVRGNILANADIVIVENLLWKGIGCNPVLNIDVKEMFIGRRLSLNYSEDSGSKYYLCEPLIRLFSRPKPLQYATLILENSYFSHHTYRDLLRIGISYHFKEAIFSNVGFFSNRISNDISLPVKDKVVFDHVEADNEPESFHIYVSTYAEVIQNECKLPEDVIKIVKY